MPEIVDICEVRKHNQNYKIVPSPNHYTPNGLEFSVQTSSAFGLHGQVSDCLHMPLSQTAVIRWMLIAAFI